MDIKLFFFIFIFVIYYIYFVTNIYLTKKDKHFRLFTVSMVTQIYAVNPGKNSFISNLRVILIDNIMYKTNVIILIYEFITFTTII